MSTPPEDAFNDHAEAMRVLGKSLSAAASIRYLPAPGSAREGSRGIPNPTLDTVLEPRRVAVSTEMTRAAIVLWKATEELTALTARVDASVAAWAGETTNP